MSTKNTKRKKMLSVVKKFSKSILKDLKKAQSKGYQMDRLLGKFGGHRGFEGAAADINQGIEDVMEAVSEAPSMVREFLEDEEQDDEE